MEGKKQASQPLKTMIPQLLISVSLFSFLLSYSSLLYSSSSSSSSSLSLSPKLHHYFNKNCLFLICNALLVFLAKTSGFIQPPTTHDLNDMLQITPLHKFVMEEETHGHGGKISADAGPKEVSIFIAESEEEDHEDQGEAAVHKLDDHETQPISRTTCWLFHDDDEQLYGQEGGEDEDEDEEEEEEEMMSTEELNKKFEDFIRKMKEEIIINEAARQKVVMLN